MLTPQDDFIGHQLATTFDEVVSPDKSWMERLWWSGHPVPSGDIIFDLGLGYHPNHKVMDAFAGITVGTKQYNIRMSRRLDDDPLTTRVGPLRISVLEGLRRHRLLLEENPSSLSFDIEFSATMNPHREAHHSGGRNVVGGGQDLTRAQQVGRYSGWIKVAGERFNLTPKTWWGQRDHSWGLRAEMRTDETSPPLTNYPPLCWTWAATQFEDHGYGWFFVDRASTGSSYATGEEVLPLGQEPDPDRLVTEVAHDYRWADDPLGQTLQDGEVRFTFAGGARRTLQIRALPARYYLKAGLYGGLRGWFFGADKGPLYIEHDVWDLNDAEVRRVARTLNDRVIEVRDGKSVGYGIIECGVSRGFPRYQSTQDYPPV